MHSAHKQLFRWRLLGGGGLSASLVVSHRDSGFGSEVVCSLWFIHVLGSSPIKGVFLDLSIPGVVF